MAKIIQRGLSQDDEQDPRKLLRDTRSMGERFSEFVSVSANAAVILGSLAASGIFLPELIDISFLSGIGLFTYTFTRKNMLPYRLPRRSHAKDYNDPKPGSTLPQIARGITFLGNDAKTNEELWFTNDDMRTHMLIFGSTGSGKTEALVSIAYNSLLQGSGFIYVDGKGDNSLFAKVFSMVRSMGREDDILLVNFMTGARDIVGPQSKRLSNTMNPFSMGSSSMLSQLVVSLMDSGSQGSGDSDMWKGRAIAFVEALMKVLVYARDKDLLLLDANLIRNYFTLDKIEAMVMDKVLLRDKQEPASLEDAPDVVMEPVQNYLYNLPGYDKSRKGKQVSQVLEQHGFITMQLTRVFSSLADTYGHIIRTQLAEVDFKDVVLNRRILVVLLPALEKSPDELANLGKVIVASLKAMMAAGLGEDVEGTYRDVIQRKPTNSPTPYVCILDEYGYYAVPGFAVVPAQARSLGFSAIFAGQDLPAFQKASKEEAASIGANTNIKICMKLEDPTDTWEFFMKTAGEAYVTKVDHFQTTTQSMTNSYMDTRSASFEKRSRIDLLDLKDQSSGEAHIFFRSRIVRAKMFYANPAPVEKMRLNQMLKVEKPKTKVVAEFHQRLTRFLLVSEKASPFDDVDVYSEDIQFLAESFATYQYLGPIERGISTLIAYQNRSGTGTTQANAQLSLEEEKEDLPEEALNLFAEMRYRPEDQSSYQTDDFAAFAMPLLNKSATQHAIETIERLSGRPENHARTIAEEIIKDMRIATFYPPDAVVEVPATELTEVLHAMIARIQASRAQSTSTE